MSVDSCYINNSQFWKAAIKPKGGSYYEIYYNIEKFVYNLANHVLFTD